MKNEDTNTNKTTPFGKEPVIRIFLRVIIFVQAITFIYSAWMWWLHDDYDKWFSRYAIGMLLLAAWGVMKHLAKNY